MTGQPNKKTTPRRKILADARCYRPFGIEIGATGWKVILVVLECRFWASNSSNVAFNPFAAIRTTVLLGSPSDGAGCDADTSMVPFSNTCVVTPRAPSVHGDHGSNPIRLSTPEIGWGLLAVRVFVHRFKGGSRKYWR